jgi:hypothetical protein
MITFLSLSPYPTTKAYGVTLKNTYEAALEFGFNARIVAPNNLQPSSYEGRLLNWILKNLRHAYRERWIIRGRIAFHLHRILFQIYLQRKLLHSAGDILWVRDVRLAYFLSKNSEISVVLEIHQLPNRRELFFLRKLPNRVVIAPISLHILNTIQPEMPTSQLTLLPMGVPDYFFRANESVRESKFTIGYFGSYRSSGHLQGVEEMLESLLPMFRNDSSFKVLLAGVAEEGFLALSEIAIKLGIQNQIALIKYLDHASVPNKMRECEALVIPYPEGPYFASRFPIKAMEYASVKVPILCSITESHGNIFSSDEVWFYDPNRSEDFISRIKELLTSPEDANLKSELAFQKASNFSYRNRIKKIANRLESTDSEILD